MVSDYGPDIDAEGAFHTGFKEAGGEIVGSVRFPVANPDFSAFVQRAKDANPDVDLYLDPGRRAARRCRQGFGRARHRSLKDQGDGKDSLAFKARAKAWARSRSASSPSATTIST